MPEISKGNAVYIDIPSPNSPHLFFVMTQQIGKPAVVIIVNVSTVRHMPFEDHTVILCPGDHPFIKHDSYVAFDYARKIRVEVIERRIKEKRAKLMDDLTDGIFQRIHDGLLQSNRTPGKLKSICRKLAAAGHHVPGQ